MLESKRIILTGAAGGLGRAIATLAIEQGANLALFEIDAERVAHATDGLPSEKAHGFAVDITDPQVIHEAVVAAANRLGGLDGIVNNAAIVCDEDTNPVDTPLAAWQRTLDVNLTGAFLICKAALPFLLKNGGGSLVTMSSVVAQCGSATPQLAYTSSKGALEAMTREIAITYARDNIRANSVAPGPILTDRTAHYFNTPQKWQTRRRHIPMGRLGKPEEIAALVCFLLSDDAAWQTGSVYRADGGISAAYLIDDRNGSNAP